MNKKILPIPLLLLLVALAACQAAQPTVSVSVPATPQAAATSAPSPDVADKNFTPTASSPEATNGNFTLASPDLPADGRLPIEYTCDGDSDTLALTWSGAPAGTVGYAVVMHHVASPADIHWYWVLYDIPADVTSLPKNVTGIGVLGNNVNNGLAEYSPPCSKGPGDKEYIYTVYALSSQPQISGPAAQVDRATLLAAIEDITLASAELHTVYARAGMTEAAAGEQPPASDQQTPPSSTTSDDPQGQPGGGIPPAEAIAACTDKAEQEACEFTSPKGTETGLCETVENQLACSPHRGLDGGGQPSGDKPQAGSDSQNGSGSDANGSAYNIEQAISDKAQGMTIAYDALAFLTGDLGSDSFFPPGKVADFWGFQYLRDNDPSQMGHAGDFLTSAAMNMLNILTEEQRAQLAALAESQVSSINEYGYKRFVLMDAFRRLLEGDLPAGTTGLSAEAVKAYSAELYLLDGEISYARAQLMGSLLNSLDTAQRASLDSMVGGDEEHRAGMLEWPGVEEPEDIRGLDRDVKVAVMTYAADMFSWYAGSIEADVYFCPERHGTYFGSFYLKDIKAMSDPSYAIPTDLTGNLGDEMLGLLDADQAELITSLVDLQKPSLLGIVETREQVSIELRKFLAGETADKATVLSLMKHYGELDGEIIYHLAVNFAKVGQTLTSEQKAQLMALREELLGSLMYPSGAYLYSQAIPMPQIPSSDFLFK